ncbi:MAG: Rpn family recombination-promoting nuclease/putative transposase [Planctomycetota bacterium JB042]
MEPNPHDRFSRRAFADLEVMRTHLRAFLPAALVAQIDLERLRREPDVLLDPDLRERLSDLLFSAPARGKRRALFWFVFEHRSTPAPDLPFDLLRSATRILESWRRAHPRERALPRIVPVVVYAGPAPFTAPRRLAELLGAGDADDGLGPDLGYVLTDLTHVDDEVLRLRTGAVAFAALSLLLLKHARSDDLFARLARGADLLRALLRAPTGLDALRTLLTYVLAVRGTDAERDLATAVLPRLDEHDRETVMGTFKSYADVLREEGMEKGLATGRAEGRRRDAAEKLLRVLRRRFEVPAALADRIEGAAYEDLDRWFDRALDADSLDEVFEPGS